MSLYTCIQRKKAPEIALPGMVVSSLRPTRAYLRYSPYTHLEKSRAYVVVRTTSNASIHIGDAGDRGQR